MKHRILTILILSILVLTLFPTIGASAQPPRAWVDPYIWSILRQEGQARVLVVLKAQADLEGARSLPTKAEKGWYVYRQLTAVAERTQGPLRAYLQDLGVPYKAYWIQNMFELAADAALVNALAARPEVDRIEYLYPVYLDVEPGIEAAPAPNTVEWNIDRVEADLVWAMGITGTGAVVADLDTGVQYDHPALVRQYRGCVDPPACTTFDHNYNWWEGPSGSPVPYDTGSHGTHTMGTMVGDDGANNQIGMAPGARWIACPGIGSPLVGPIECFQWFLAPTDLAGQNPRPDLAPHVINNSWSSAGTNYRDIIHTLYMAGIYYAKSAGNTGPSCSTITNPGQWAEVSATAAFAQGDTIASFSSRGPVTVDHEVVVKPDIAAPGVNVRSSIPGNNYGSMQGTSMACPHQAGAVALLVSARPDLAGQIDTLQRILKVTAEPKISAQCPPFVDHPNDVWGWGILNIYNAVQYAQTLGVGRLDGTVTAANTSDPLEGVRLDLTEEATGWTLIPRYTDATGYYTYTAIPTGTFHLTATLYGYLPATATVSIQEGVTVTQDLALQPSPLYTISGYVLEQGTNAPLRATLTFEGTPLVVQTDPATGYYSTPIAVGTFWTRVASPGHTTQWVKITVSGNVGQDFALEPIQSYYMRSSDQPCGPTYNWIDATDGTAHPLSDDAYFALSLGQSFTFYGNTYTNVFVGSNGIATFQLPADKWSGPIPDPATPNNGIYAFSTDLNPASGSQGNIYHKWVNNNSVLVLEWYQVQHYPSGSPETFEILLDMASGSVTMQYQTVSDPTDIPGTVGVENATGTEATAYNDFPHAGLALAFYPAFGIQPAEQGMGTLEGTVVVSGTTEPIPGALIAATDALGDVFTTTADLSGTYSTDLCADFYQVEASATGYLPAGPVTTIVFSGDSTTQDFALRPLLPDIVPPAPPPPLVLYPGEQATHTLIIGNEGQGSLTWALEEHPEVPWLQVYPLDGVLPPGDAAHLLLTYTAPITVGVYTTTLLLTSNDPVSPVVDIPVQMQVVPVPCAAVQILAITPTVEGCQAAFQAQVSGDEPISYLWAFGDGITSTEAMPTHTYTQTGTYSGTLELWNCGNTGYAWKDFAVAVSCEQRFAIFLPLVLRGYGP